MSEKRYKNAKEYLAMLQEIDSQSSGDGSDSEVEFPGVSVKIKTEDCDDSDDDIFEEIESDSDNSDNEVNEPYLDCESLQNIVAPDGTMWQTFDHNSVPVQGRGSAVNIFPGPTSYAKRNIVAESPLSSFRLIINESILNHISKCTEMHAKEQNYNLCLNAEELLKFIALVYARGLMGLNSMSVKICWDKKYGPKIFSDSMSRNRFLEILRYLRFDEKETRSQRLVNDKFALVSDVWYNFISNSQACYNPGKSVTVDTQLYPMKSKCRFIQYVPNKPGKFGMKFWMLVDGESKYFLNGFPYLGKDNELPQDLGEYVVLRLLDPYYGSGINVTCSNYFSTVALAENLKSKKLSLVGNVRKSRIELPAVLKPNIPLHSAKLYINQYGHLLTKYQYKKDKNVLVLSTVHSDIILHENNVKKKPETVLYFNKNKKAVDILDSMCKRYSTRAATHRWPVHVFYNVLDLAAVNSWILYKKVTKKKVSRRSFLIQLIEEIVGLHPDGSVEEPSTSAEETITSFKRKRCQIQTSCKNKSNKVCIHCGKVCCGRCAVVVTRCKKCA